MRAAGIVALFAAVACAAVAQPARRMFVQPNGDARFQQQHNLVGPGMMRVMWVSLRLKKDAKLACHSQ